MYVNALHIVLKRTRSLVLRLRSSHFSFSFVVSLLLEHRTATASTVKKVVSGVASYPETAASTSVCVQERKRALRETDELKLPTHFGIGLPCG